MKWMRIFRQQFALQAFLSVLVIIIPLCVLFEPRWESNDDIGMSMIAHGYGLAEFGSPKLIFSNVLWGYFVRLMPDINGILGYTIASILSLVAAGVAIFYALLRCGTGFWIGFCIVFLILFRSTLWVQFTINSGLLAVAAIMWLALYSKFGNIFYIAVACVLAFFSFLIRWHEFILVLVVASPMLLVRQWRADRLLQASLLMLTSLMIGAACFDFYSYKSPDWEYFHKVNAARIPITDFSMATLLKQQPDRLRSLGYSFNDIELIENFFFVDSEVLNIPKINQLTAGLISGETQRSGIKMGMAAVKSLFDPALMVLSGAALLVFIIIPSKKVLVSIGLLIFVVVSMGVAGRPSVIRVYFPLVCWLLVMPFLLGRTVEVWRRWVVIMALFSAIYWNWNSTSQLLSDTNINIRTVRSEILNMSPGTYAVWGVDLPMEFIYTLFAKRSVIPGGKIYSLGVFTFAPFAVAEAEIARGFGFIDRILSPEGLKLIASSENIERLMVWCEERKHGSLTIAGVYASYFLNINQVKCVRDAPF